MSMVSTYMYGAYNTIEVPSTAGNEARLFFKQLQKAYGQLQECRDRHWRLHRTIFGRTRAEAGHPDRDSLHGHARVEEHQLVDRQGRKGQRWQISGQMRQGDIPVVELCG